MIARIASVRIAFTRIACLICVLTLGGLTSLSYTAQSQSDVSALNMVQSERDRGVIADVDRENKTFALERSGGSKITIRVTDETSFTLDGEESTMEEALRAGHEAVVTHSGRVAESVDATSTS